MRFVTVFPLRPAYPSPNSPTAGKFPAAPPPASILSRAISSCRPRFFDAPQSDDNVFALVLRHHRKFPRPPVPDRFLNVVRIVSDDAQGVGFVLFKRHDAPVFEAVDLSPALEFLRLRRFDSRNGRVIRREIDAFRGEPAPLDLSHPAPVFIFRRAVRIVRLRHARVLPAGESRAEQ
jgi:hypothetical protein